MPSACMPAPDPIYCRPVIPFWIMKSYRQFSEVCQSGDLTEVAELMDMEPRSQQYLNDGLRAAIYKKDVRIVGFILNKIAKITPEVALAAAAAKSLAIFQLVLEHGWNINAPILGDSTALTRILDDEQLVRWFLVHGAQLDPPSGSFNPSAAKVFMTNPSVCLDIAASKSSIAVIDLLLEHGATIENSLALHKAAGSGAGDERVPIMAHLIALGYDANATDDIRKNHALGTPLHYAISARSLAKVEFLLQHGADPHKPVGRSGSAYLMAKCMGLDEIADLMNWLS